MPFPLLSTEVFGLSCASTPPALAFAFSPAATPIPSAKYSGCPDSGVCLAAACRLLVRQRDAKPGQRLLKGLGRAQDRTATSFPTLSIAAGRSKTTRRGCSRTRTQSWPRQAPARRRQAPNTLLYHGLPSFPVRARPNARPLRQERIDPTAADVKRVPRPRGCRMAQDVRRRSGGATASPSAAGREGVAAAGSTVDHGFPPGVTSRPRGAWSASHMLRGGMFAARRATVLDSSARPQLDLGRV